MRKHTLTFLSIVLFSLTTLLATGACAQPKSAIARRAQDKYHYVWQLVEDNYFWHHRLSKWSSWKHRFDTEISDDSDANKYIAKMLRSLKDRWTYFMGVKQTDKDTQRSQATSVVTSRLLPNNIGYIKIHTFSSKNAAAETAIALKSLSTAAAYVLDLRDNRGGHKQESLAVFAMFMEEGLYSRMEARRKGQSESMDYVLTRQHLQITRGGKTQSFPRSANLAGRKPLVVLVNGDTCSCAESLAGALRDHGRALLFGSRTFGKAVATHTYQLEGYVSVQIVFARSTLPGGSCIHDVGITPDRKIKLGSGGDEVLKEACRHLEKLLKP